MWRTGGAHDAQEGLCELVSFHFMLMGNNSGMHSSLVCHQCSCLSLLLAHQLKSLLRFVPKPLWLHEERLSFQCIIAAGG